jgi:hypothetical protein
MSMEGNSNNGIGGQPAAPVGSASAGQFGGMGDNPMDGGPNPFAQKPSSQPQQQQNNSGIEGDPRPPTAEPRGEGIIPRRGEPTEGPNPLDKYMKKPDNGNNGEPASSKQPAAPANQPKGYFDYSRDDYEKALGGDANDYVGEISAELMTSIQQGDIKAFKSLLNNAITKGSSQSAFAVSQVSKRGVAQQLESYSKGELQEILRNQQFDQSFEGMDSEVLNHPSVAPLAKSKMAEFRQQYPEASPQEITKATERYFEELAEAFSGSSRKRNEQPKSSPKGLSSFFNS